MSERRGSQMGSLSDSRDWSQDWWLIGLHNRGSEKAKITQIVCVMKLVLGSCH